MERVLIVDDQAYFCHLAREILSKCSTFTVVAESNGAHEAMELVEELKPDIVLMDVAMDEMNGPEATHVTRRRFPGIWVVLMSVYDAKEYSRLADRVGALAFIPKKDLSGPVLAQALREESLSTAGR